MSIESMVIAFHHSKSRGTTKLVLLGIANHDGDGGAWPAIATLARYANTSERTVQRAIAELESLGEIRRHVQDGGLASWKDHLRPNRYEILLRCPPMCDRSAAHLNNAHTFTAVDVIRGPWGDATVTPPGDASVTPPGDASVTLTIPSNHPLNRPIDRSALRSRPEAVATRKQKKYIRHIQDQLGDGWANEDPALMSFDEADGWIKANMGSYREAGGGS